MPNHNEIPRARTNSTIEGHEGVFFFQLNRDNKKTKYETEKILFFIYIDLSYNDIECTCWYVKLNIFTRRKIWKSSHPKPTQNRLLFLHFFSSSSNCKIVWYTSMCYFRSPWLTIWRLTFDVVNCKWMYNVTVFFSIYLLRFRNDALASSTSSLTAWQFSIDWRIIFIDTKINKRERRLRLF